MAQESLVFYASPGMGHFGSMVEFAKLVVANHPNFSITILFNTLPTIPKSSFDPLIASVAASTPSITFHHLQSLPTAPSSSFIELSLEIPRLSCPEISNMLKTMSSQTKLRAFVLDFFCNAAFEVANSLDIPTYYFYVSGACGLAAFLSFPAALRAAEASQDTRTVLNLPGLPPFPLSYYPEICLEGNLSGLFKSASINMAKSRGVVSNTFRALDEWTLGGLSVLDGPTPPIYCIGPLVVGRTPGERGEERECLRWLDSQPSKSVIFLCFGSMGVFSGKQLKEMAIGLESSGHRFLWVVRNPPDEEKKELEELFPSGFLERTKERGLVLRNWAPQVAVLGHDSVGGFVTHCGWNSIIESVCAGVPMLAWPLYAEQKINREALVGVTRLALRLNESEEEVGFVSAVELEKRVRELMDTDSDLGMEVRERVCAMKLAAEAAVSAGGSSHLELSKLVESFK